MTSNAWEVANMSDFKERWSIREYSTIAVPFTPLCGVKMLCYDQSGFLKTDSKHKFQKKEKKKTFFKKKEGEVGEGKEIFLKTKFNTPRFRKNVEDKNFNAALNDSSV